MAGELHVDMTSFKKTMNAYLASTSKSMVRALNSKAYEIAWQAEKLTKRASRAAIEELGVIATQVFKKNGDRLRRTRSIYAKSSRARAIVAARKRKTGEEIITRDLEKEAAKLIGARLKAVGYLASGWIPAIRRLLRLADFKKSPPTSVKRGGRNTGFATIATTKRQEAVIGNSVGALAKDDNSRTLAESALGRAVAIVQADMEAYLVKKFKGAARENGIETR